MSAYKDFDKMFPELVTDKPGKDANKGCIKIFGKEYYFSLNPPAALMLAMVRHTGEENVPWRTMVRIAYGIFGEKTLDELSMHPAFSAKVLSAMIDYAIRAINGIDETPKEVTEDDFGASDTKKK